MTRHEEPIVEGAWIRRVAFFFLNFIFKDCFLLRFSSVALLRFVVVVSVAATSRRVGVGRTNIS